MTTYETPPKATVQAAPGRKRVFHWLIAAAFIAMVLTGLTIYTPALSSLAAGGWTRLVHRIAAVVLLGAPLVYGLVNRRAARQWLREAAIWNKTVPAAPYVLNPWKRRHKFLISIGYLLFAATGMLQWFLKGVVSSSVFNVSIFIHDILFFGAILVLLYHMYFELYWWLWKRRYCSRCDFAYCAEACPVGAIASGENSITRDPQRCNNCRLCVDVCRRNSYHKKTAATADTATS